MAGFETIVRPVVFPSIRPQAPRVLPPASDDPEQGIAVIRGNPGQQFDLSYSYSFSASSSSSTETEREVDVERVYQEEDDGTINRDNFVDIEVAKKISKRGYNGDDWSPDRDPGQDPPTTRGKRSMEWINKYKPAKEDDNIEILKRDQIRKNEDAE